jgi:hypothetical protein
MTLRDKILAEHSRANCTKIVRWIGNNQSRFDELAHLFFHDDHIVVQRAGWPMSEVIIAHPSWGQKHLRKLIRYVKEPGHHEAVKRNIVRMFQIMDIPEKFQGDVMNLCFDYILSPSEKPAVKAFSLTVLHKLSKKYPEIRPELKTIIEERWDLETAAFRSRAKKMLKEF